MRGNADHAFGILCRICHRGEEKQNVSQAKNISRALPGRALGLGARRGALRIALIHNGVQHFVMTGCRLWRVW